MEGNDYGPSWALSGNFLVLTEKKREDFNFEQCVSFPTPNATTCPFVDFVVLPPGHGRSVTDF